MRRKAFRLLLALLAFGIFLPVSNLLGLNGRQAPIAVQGEDALFRKVSPIFQSQCADCHSPALTRMPLYANFPVAGDLIRADIHVASDRLLLTPQHYSGEARFTPLDLARVEGAVLQDTMPPLRYKLMHWGAGLSADERKTILDWIAAERAKLPLAQEMIESLRGEPVQPLPRIQAVWAGLSPAKVTLGRQLFHDPRLSADGTLSCASCHTLNQGGTDRRRVSIGIRGQEGPINAPTVYNAVYNLAQFWDGRAKDLQEQAAGPVTNPVEMGAQWPQVVDRLRQDPTYIVAFQALYPDEGLTRNTVTDAIAHFEESLVTGNSRFDRYLRGETSAINAGERRGYELFKNLGCVTCHAGPALGGGSFEKFGVRQEYFKARGNLTDADNGRFNVTQNEADRHFFKVPTLRNIALTAPYFHDGSAPTLTQAVQTMAKYQLGKTLKPDEVKALVAFLETLTGEFDGKPLGATPEDGLKKTKPSQSLL